MTGIKPKSNHSSLSFVPVFISIIILSELFIDTTSAKKCRT